MCFSASASFVVSGGLAAIGVASFRVADKKQRVIAAIPFLFAIQQAFEGFQWLALDAGSVNWIAAYGFLFFALLVWPVYVPAVVFMFDKKRRGIIALFIGIGVVLATYFTVLLSEPFAVRVFDKSIHYQLNTPSSSILTSLIYGIGICGALFVSSKREFRWFGTALFASGAVSALFFFTTFVSVWCFFAAILSSLIYVYLKRSH